jgi:hypothetical protein
VVWDGITVWARPGTRAAKTLEEAQQLFQLVVGAYALLRRAAYDVTLDGWVEAERATLADSFIGFMSQQREPGLAPRIEQAEDADLRTAIAVAGWCRDQPWWRVALRDLHAAFGERGDDAFLYAYRAVEGACRALTGADDLSDRDWRAFIGYLGSDEQIERSRIALLRQARAAVAHGDENDPNLQRARQQRTVTITTARDVLAEALIHTDAPLAADTPLR